MRKHTLHPTAGDTMRWLSAAADMLLALLAFGFLAEMRVFLRK